MAELPANLFSKADFEFYRENNVCEKIAFMYNPKAFVNDRK